MCSSDLFSDSCGIRTQPDWRERPATSPEVQRADFESRTRTALSGGQRGSHSPLTDSSQANRVCQLPLSSPAEDEFHPRPRAVPQRKQARCPVDTGPAKNLRSTKRCQPESAISRRRADGRSLPPERRARPSRPGSRPNIGDMSADLVRRIEGNGRADMMGL